jgi:hypothetical protein
LLQVLPWLRSSCKDYIVHPKNPKRYGCTIADLLLSESVYINWKKGNIVERSGAVVMKALGEGGYVRSPEIIDTPQQGTAVTQRFGIQFDPTKTDYSIWTLNGSARSIA